MPPTTGGSTSGTITRARARPRPGSRVRASSQASGTPSSMLTPVAAVAHSSDSRSAVQVSVLRQVLHELPPRRLDQQPDHRQDQEGQARQGREQQDRGRAPLVQAARARPAATGRHGAWNPALSRACSLEAERTKATKACAALGFGASLSTSIG